MQYWPEMHLLCWWKIWYKRSLWRSTVSVVSNRDENFYKRSYRRKHWIFHLNRIILQPKIIDFFTRSYVYRFLQLFLFVRSCNVALSFPDSLFSNSGAVALFKTVPHCYVYILGFPWMYWSEKGLFFLPIRSYRFFRYLRQALLYGIPFYKFNYIFSQ